MRINRRQFAVGIAGIAMLGTATQVSSGSNTIRIVHIFSGESQIHSELAQLVPDMEAETDHSVRFEVYSAEELGVTDSLMLGKFDGVFDFVLSPAHLFAPRQSDVNFLARSDLFWSADLWKQFNGSEAEVAVASLFEKDSLELMGSAWIGSEHLIASKPIAGVDDLSGIKMRAGDNPIYDEVFETLGATPVVADWSESYTALQTGVIDASVQPIIWKDASHLSGDGNTIVRNSFGGYVAWLVGAAHWREDVDAVTAELVKSVMADSMVSLGIRIDAFEKVRLKEYAETGWAVADWNNEDMQAMYGALRKAHLEALSEKEREIAELIEWR